MLAHETRTVPDGDPAAVLTKAVLRAADRLDLRNRTVATTLGLSEATVSRMRAGGYSLQPGQKSFELGLLLVRLYRSLDAIMGGDDAASRAWLRTGNTVLGGEPLAMIQTISGLMNAVQYLDSRRARI